MIAVWRVVVAVAFVSTWEAIVPGMQSNLFMATYPVRNFRRALQGVIGTGVKEKIIDSPECVGAYTGSSGGDDKPRKSIVPGRYFMK